MEAGRIRRYRHRQHCVSRGLFQVASRRLCGAGRYSTRPNKFAYYGRLPGDIESAPTLLAHWTAGQGDEPQLTLTKTIEPKTRDWLSPKMSAAEKQGATDSTKMFDFESPALTQFWGRSMHIRAWVLLPPGYNDHPKQRYPTVYFTHGFGGTMEYNKFTAAMLYQRMAEGEMPPMIWVLLDESSPRGTHEFADSVNNGPWGQALTQEAIPALEREYRMDAKPSGRFLNGHSSGGWATLWLQVTYPKIFGGTWSTSPDPSDFHDFTGIDLYAAHANAYRKPDGTPYPIIRDKGKVMATFQELTQLEDVLGHYGGQIRSFDWVFSPRGQGGRPEPMFNHYTGDVDPAVVAYWQQHYDIAYRVAQQWPTIGHDLRGKVHCTSARQTRFIWMAPRTNWMRYSRDCTQTSISPSSPTALILIFTRSGMTAADCSTNRHPNVCSGTAKGALEGDTNQLSEAVNICCRIGAKLIDFR